MTLCEQKGDESFEGVIERLGLKCKEVIISGSTLPPTPFLLVEDNEYLVVESWKESDIQALRDCKFMQNIIFEGHEASEEEIEKFSRDEDT